jgi:hypothetical protein
VTSMHPSSSRLVVRFVAAGQIGFALFIALCVALSPHYVLKANEGGISNFGVHLRTIVPYSIALLLPAAFTYAASRLVAPANSRLRHIQIILGAYSALILLTLLTTYTYKIDEPFKVVHIGVGAIITIFEMGATLWMYRQLHALLAALVVQVIGFVLATLTIFGALHLLFVTQILVGVPFAWFLVRTCPTLNSSSTVEESGSGVTYM